MKNILTVILYLVVFWNLENFFETGVSKRRFFAEAGAVTKTLLWIGDERGRMPDLVGVAEIENAAVLRVILRATALRKYYYRYLHYDSPDPRGIDVGLIYNKESLRYLSSRPVPVPGGATRDILCASFLCEDGDTLNVLVNHHPSKLGGEEISRTRRNAAMETMVAACDSLGGRRIISMGDFNDVPSGEAFALTRGRLENLGLPLWEAGEGSLRFEGKWELIDNFLVSEDLAGEAEMSVEYPPFLLVPDKKYGGVKPLRTYSGPRYLGGVSDHLPVTLTCGRRQR